MYCFYLKIHQNVFGCRTTPDPVEGFKTLPRSAVAKRVGQGREGAWRGGKGMGGKRKRTKKEIEVDG